MARTARETTNRHDGGGASDRSDAPTVRIVLLGDFQITIDGRRIVSGDWKLKKAKAIVKLLALAPRQAMHRDELLDLLWPELDPDAATNNLRYALHVARQTVEPTPGTTRRLLRWHGEQLHLAPETATWIDVVAFEAAARDAHRSGDRAGLQHAVDLYTGDLLPEDRYEEWATLRREVLRETHLALLIDLAHRHQAAGDYRQEIETLRRAIAVEPSREEPHAALMRAYARIGQRRLALRQYATLAEALQRDLDAEPDPATQRLHDEIVSGSVSPGQTATAHEPLLISADERHNLPVPLTNFIGRRAELRELDRLLLTTRLLTITGIGGSGKTRLAVEFAARQTDTFVDGVWLVELAGLSDGSLIEQSIARVIGATDESGRTPRESLIASLRHRSALIILDNCEHLIEASAEVALALLSACPDLRVLATSREALGVPGEVVWPLPNLSLPSDDGVRFEAALNTEAVRLFVDRARYRQPAFQLTSQNTPAVIEICRRVEGIALAIELAAARTLVLSPDEIAARLNEPLGLLAGGSRATAPRHRSLRQVLDWSHALLSADERYLFAVVSTFAGGWDLDSAEAIVAETPSMPMAVAGDVLDLLSLLVDKSLVVAQTSTIGVTRYSLLAPVRDYGQEQLAARGQADHVRGAHAAWFTQLAEQARLEISSERQRYWLDRLEIEHDNLRAALLWSLDNELDLASRLVAALWRFWWMHGHFTEGERWIERTLRSVDASSTAARARSMQAAGSLAWAQGHYDRSLPYIKASLALYRALDDADGVTAALSALGSILGNQGDYVRARAAHEEGLALARANDDRLGVETALGNLADIAYYQGDYESARTWWEESLSLQRESGGEYGVAIILNNLAELARNEGDYDRAAPLLDEALTLFRIVDFKHGIAIALANLADVRSARGEDVLAGAHLRESLTVARELRSAVVSAGCLDLAAKLAAAAGQAERAARLFGAADGLREAAGASLSPADRSILHPAIEAAQAVLGEARWRATHATGTAMSVEDAIEYALTDLDATAADLLPAGRSTPDLTARERQVALLVAQELTNRQVADRLGMANRTVDTHVSNILRKLDLPSRTGLRGWAFERGLLPVDDREPPAPPTHT